MKKGYYLYRHVRLDKNEPFYIGIGVIHEKYPLLKSRYERAFSGKKRNSYWNNIISKTDYNIDILLESENREFIIEKEIEFIKLYGRKDNNTGTLSNMTDGGEGGFGTLCNKGRIPSEETREKLRIARRDRDPKTIGKRSIKILQYDLKGNFIKEWESMASTRKEGFDPSTVTKCCKGTAKTHKEFVFKYKNII